MGEGNLLPSFAGKAYWWSARKQRDSTGRRVEGDRERIEDVAAEQAVERIAGHGVNDDGQGADPSPRNFQERDGHERRRRRAGDAADADRRAAIGIDARARERGGREPGGSPPRAGAQGPRRPPWPRPD